MILALLDSKSTDEQRGYSRVIFFLQFLNLLAAFKASQPDDRMMQMNQMKKPVTFDRTEK